MTSTSSVHDFLRDAQVPYVVMPHPPAFTAQEEAAAVHVPGRTCAKVVICLVDDEPVEALVPATLIVNLDRLRTLARGRTVRLADEKEPQGVFHDCDPGALAAFSPLYALDVTGDVA